MKKPIASVLRRSASSASDDPTPALPPLPAPAAAPVDEPPSLVDRGTPLIKPVAEMVRSYGSDERTEELAAEEAALASDVERARERMKARAERRRETLAQRNRALLPRPDDPNRALNIEAAREHQVILDQLDRDDEIDEGAIAAFNERRAAIKRSEAMHDAFERSANQQQLADDRQAAAAEYDRAIKLMADARRKLEATSERFYQSLAHRDSNASHASMGGFTKAEAAARSYARHCGVVWAAPADIFYREHVPSTAEFVADANKALLGMQNQIRSAAQ